MERLEKAETAAREALAKTLQSEEIEIIGRDTALIPGTNEQVFRFTGAAPGNLNSPAQVVVDSAGTIHDLSELEAQVGRRIFIPEVGAVAASAIPARTLVPIDPPSNELTLPFCHEESEHVTVTIPKSGALPKADVYLLSDTTGSMTSVLEAIKAGVGVIVGNPALAPYDVAYGVGNYKDFPSGVTNPYAFQHQLSPTTNTALVSSAIATWRASGGIDYAEGQLFALHRLAIDPAIGWRSGARRIVVWFGDCPGHDPVCTSLTGEGSDITEGSVTGELLGEMVTVVAISTTTGCPNGLDDNPVPHSSDYVPHCGAPGGSAGQATRITSATGGSHTVGVNAGTIVATLTALIEAAVTSTGNVQLVPSPSISGFVESVTPPGGYGPLPGNVEHRLGFDVQWVGTQACTEGDQTVTGTLDVVADGVTVAQKPVRITIPACRYHHAVEMLCGTFGTGDERCESVVPGRYATAITIYNPWACTVSIEKCFTPLVLRNEALGREPLTVRCRPFAEIKLGPGEATMDDCCSLEPAIGPTPGVFTLGVLDVVASRPLEVTAIITATSRQQTGTSVHTRRVKPRSDA